MAIGKRGLGGARLKLSRPARMALSVAIAVLLAGFGGYILWAGEIRMPFHWSRRGWYEQPAHFRFEGGQAKLLATGFLFVAAAVVAQIALQLRADPRREGQSSLALALACTGLVIIAGLYVLKLVGVI